MAEDEPKRPDLNVISSTRDGRDVTRGLTSPDVTMLPTDSVLQLRGNGNYQIYLDTLRDDQVGGTFETRRLAVTSREWEVKPGGESALDKQAAEHLKEQLDALDWDDITDKMLFGRYYGFSVAEIIWTYREGKVAIGAIKVRDRRRFGFDGEMRLRLRTPNNYEPGELLPDRKFWVFCCGADNSDEPYGLGLAHWLYWLVFFKKAGTKFWLKFLDKFGTPTVLGKYGHAYDNDQGAQDKLLQTVRAIATDSGAIVPEGIEVDLLEAARNGSGSYEDLYDRMDAAIAKRVLGQTLTTEAAGGQYKADVQNDVRMELVKADADLICNSFSNSVAAWLTEWNFPGAAVPKVWRILNEEEDLSQAADRDSKLSQVGYRPTPERVRQVYGEGYEEVAPRPPGAMNPPPGSGAFAEPATGDAQGALTAAAGKEVAPAEGDWIQRIKAEADQAESLQDLRDRIERALPELGRMQFAEAMQKALAAAFAAGQFEVTQNG